MIRTTTDTQTTPVQRIWQGPPSSLKVDPQGIQAVLQRMDAPCYIVHQEGSLAATNQGESVPRSRTQGGSPLVASAQPLSAEQLGNPAFRSSHQVKLAYMAGSMANGIAGPEFVTTMGKAGLLASYGAGGILPGELKQAIRKIKHELPRGPYAFNLLHSPNEPSLEQKTVDIYLEHDILTVETSAFLRLTPTIVQYRVSGLEEDERGKVVINHKVIAKLSRREVARQFMRPAPDKLLQPLVEAGKITPRQAKLAKRVPMADDITVEADSGGHTDNRPMNSLLPSIIALRDVIQGEENYHQPIRIGAAGGIGTPTSALGALAMGAEYVLTGSINQGSVEAQTSQRVKDMLAQAASTDVKMAPAADMFEMGVEVQVLKRGTMFPMRAQKLYDLYQNHDSVESINGKMRQELEEKILKRSVDAVWDDCVSFFQERDPSQLERARNNPKRKMALIFRWYLGLATHWAIQGKEDRALDYQVWCGPAMGAFNDWTRGTYLEDPENRHAVDIAQRIMTGAAYLYRLQTLGTQGVSVPPAWRRLIDSPGIT